ncbi:hypothetical protein J1614_011175 [Plenodomus biglobosus]|nr:hypothetical protein J1614_011175 [Plenodomus biglobosus]
MPSPQTPASGPDNRCTPIGTWAALAELLATTTPTTPTTKNERETNADRVQLRHETVALSLCLLIFDPPILPYSTSNHVRRAPLPALLPAAAALPALGLDQQACVLLLDYRGLGWPRLRPDRPADSEMDGRGAYCQDSHDISSAKGTATKANWL